MKRPFDARWLSKALLTQTETMNAEYDEASIAASLEDFEHDRSPTLHPSLQNSAFRSDDSEIESDRSSTPWSPPAWRKGSSGWMRQHRFPPPGASRSNSASPLYESAGEGDDTVLPNNIPLPPSPSKETPVDDHETSPEYGRAAFPQPFGGGQPAHDRDRESSAAPEHAGNCMFPPGSGGGR